MRTTDRDGEQFDDTHSSMPEGERVWTHPNGALRIYDNQDRSVARPSLVEVEHSNGQGEWYGIHFIQFPERGYRCGGSAWSYGPQHFRGPQTAEELLWVLQYQTAKRVIDLRAELAEAEADEAAVKRYTALVRASDESTVQST